MQVKASRWFAAGPEVERALLLLSDGAFKLYFHLCLNASRATGIISITYKDVAKALHKSPRSIATYFDELRDRGVCHVLAGANQHKCSQVEICADFWPYTKDAPTASSGLEEYLSKIQQFMSARACVHCSFNAADRTFASELMAREIPLEQVEHGIMLGCARKYVSFLNGNDGGPIRSFAYFRDLIEEAAVATTPSAYWDYLRPELVSLEMRWSEGTKSVSNP